VIRWEEHSDGNWLGYSGQALVATATKADENRWDWEDPGAGKPKGWRNSGHRTNELDARRAADAYWDKWLATAALKPDLGRLAETSIPSKPCRKAKAETKAAPARAEAPQSSLELDAAKAKIEDLQRRLERAEGRASKAEERASAAEPLAKARRRRTSALPGCGQRSASRPTPRGYSGGVASQARRLAPVYQTGHRYRGHPRRARA
jgi:hypothetical protein